MRILVTGGAGYIGSVSVELFLREGHEVVVLDDLSTGHRGAVPSDARLEVGTYGDTRYVADLLEKHRIEAVLHCAAKSLVGESMTDPAKYFRENVGGGIALLEAMRLVGVRRMAFSSTAATYGMPDRVPVVETDPIRPINAYGESKRCVEAAIRWYAYGHGLRAVILRYFNAAGASDERGECHVPETHLVPALLEAAAAGREATIFGDDYPTPDGTCVRDYIHVEDLAVAHLRALEATDPSDTRTGPDSGACEPLICNLGNGSGFSNRQVLASVERAIGRPLPVKIGPRRPGDPPVLVASARNALDKLGWKPAHDSLDEIVESAWVWKRSHPNGYAE